MNPDARNWAWQVGQTDKKDGAVEGITVDEIMRRKDVMHIDILKVDIEGAEKEVFSNASAWIEHISVIMAELHPHISSECTRNVYNATKSFNYKAAKGANVIIMREECLL